MPPPSRRSASRPHRYKPSLFACAFRVFALCAVGHIYDGGLSDLSTVDVVAESLGQLFLGWKDGNGLDML